jgi:hypothetical protein
LFIKTSGYTYCIDNGLYGSFAKTNSRVRIDEDTIDIMKMIGMSGRSESKLDLKLQEREHLSVRSTIDPECRVK